tara:strand:+ start:1410 stop:1859 length:450 start_codon:yes stop_codon:yes gene_type:complete
MSKARELPPFNPQAVCSKCSNTQIQTVYCTDSWDGQNNCPYRIKTMEVNEHFHRICLICNHQWLEAPLKNGEAERRLQEIHSQLLQGAMQQAQEGQEPPPKLERPSSRIIVDGFTEEGTKRLDRLAQKLHNCAVRILGYGKHSAKNKKK